MPFLSCKEEESDLEDGTFYENISTLSWSTFQDPLISGSYGAEHTIGLQNGTDPRYLQAVATLKHFAANSLEGTWDGPGGPKSYPGTGLCPGGECTRHTIDPKISQYDLHTSYLPAFRQSVVEGGALGVMCSYNAINGVPSCANKWLLEETLRDKWGCVTDVFTEDPV